MSATATTTEQEYRCSCGRTFAHEISLKRHRWVTGHAEAEAGATVEAAAPAAAITPVAIAPATNFAAAPVAIDAEETYRQAVAVLIQKRMELEAEAEAQRKAAQRQALVREFVIFLQTGLLGLTRGAQSCGRATAGAASVVLGWTVKLMVVAALAFALLGTGMGVGRLLADRADAQTSNPGTASVSQQFAAESR